MTTTTYTKNGAKSTTAAKLNKTVFESLPENHELLKLAYVAYLANGRENLAVTKTRGLVRGGGRKPWKQKGTGRARFGSIRNPIWRGGGIVFGPTGEENYSKKLPVIAKRKALCQALSLSAKENRIKILEELESRDNKTASMAQLLQKIEAKGSVLLVVEYKDESLSRATNNLPNVKLVSAKYLNVFDIMNSDVIVITSKSLNIIGDWLGSEKPAKAEEKK